MSIDRIKLHTIATHIALHRGATLNTNAPGQALLEFLSGTWVGEIMALGAVCAPNYDGLPSAPWRSDGCVEWYAGLLLRALNDNNVEKLDELLEMAGLCLGTPAWHTWRMIATMGSRALADRGGGQADQRPESDPERKAPAQPARVHGPSFGDCEDHRVDIGDVIQIVPTHPYARQYGHVRALVQWKGGVPGVIADVPQVARAAHGGALGKSEWPCVLVVGLLMNEFQRLGVSPFAVRTEPKEWPDMDHKPTLPTL